MKTVKFFTLGCKVNQYDTQSIRQRFLDSGFKELENGMPADIYVVNTCTVTHKADIDSYNLIRRTKRQNPGSKVIVTGCLVENNAADLSRTKEVDFIISKRFFPDGVRDFTGRTRAFLKIQDGCNNFCSYCKVPYARGRSRSRRGEEIINEARHLVKRGFKEIVLSGICLGSYGRDIAGGTGLIDIIGELEKIDGLLRIRLSSIEPDDVSDALIEKIAVSKKLCPHLHIPLQSGDDSILKAMRRNYRRDFYLNLAAKIRKLIPQAAITTDVLVGFPGESENNFANTINLVKEILPLKVHIFPYSARQEAASAKFSKNEIAGDIIRQRIHVLNKAAEKTAFIFKKSFLGSAVSALMEVKSKDMRGFYEGYTGTYIKVVVKSDADIRNKLVKVRLLQGLDSRILGSLLNFTGYNCITPTLDNSPKLG
ncbi:MAG: tRNA (N(6)-L-threonylcarbamoyladenosine(37)-C(2))-methylthiotransferase MtaB [Candidatus Omnitrophica bacterium CG11_big_fil_rev_8_21_14_0_20_42_13]|uniref:tRNA (N(6)-L-threonylcarbamoyladenosine(37)-C(2))-methylthiotransferase MtaB n=1 Tax=Candidatus Ghiorseimicrobium undicola TaxID=1974746 RepID=A0A2H0LWG6_9BACT|nr:MAG: tRNA (N(6)-L-threonylcarbamoyladenosine(37)-C(2))-methylthiotransferase MtaB [Candidatus Omnitrophica bacterium CG11_big_fil_rev_8_21_14_0_20_42_13]